MINYHFHIYYDLSCRNQAKIIQDYFLSRQPNHDVSVGQMWDKLIGPHSKPQFALEYLQRDTNDCFKKIYDYLLLNRNDLSVLIHPLINDEVKAHTTMAVWMGNKLDLDLGKL